MDTETQKKLAKIQPVSLDSLVKLQVQTTRLIEGMAATNKLSRSWATWLMAAACLAVGSAIVAAGMQFGMQFGKLFRH
ncbi:hypothetical protein [Paraburkholderia tropica]|uniref:hypothetical protein n=1 Tax=Paraburkholderia tropica TaxID=92647 RepID=UPI002ABE05EA|nr:hypothetical protein [Paraburkholderia tropica]